MGRQQLETIEFGYFPSPTLIAHRTLLHCRGRAQNKRRSSTSSSSQSSSQSINQSLRQSVSQCSVLWHLIPRNSSSLLLSLCVFNGKFVATRFLPCNACEFVMNCPAEDLGLSWDKNSGSSVCWQLSEFRFVRQLDARRDQSERAVEK